MAAKSSYEKLRSENLRRNEAFLQSIGIDDAKKRVKSGGSITDADAPSDIVKPTRAKRQKLNTKPEVQEPPRRSTRLTRSNDASDDITPPPPPIDKRIRLMENLLMTEEGDQEVSLKQLLLSLEDRHDLRSDVLPEEHEPTKFMNDEQYSRGLGAMFKSPGGVHSDHSSDNESKLTESVDESYDNHPERSEEDVSKVTKTKMTEIRFHPCTHQTVVVGGDDTGHVGIWDTTTTTSTTHFLCRPHTNTVTGLHVYHSQRSTLWTVSMDKTIRWTDLEKEQFIEAYRSDTALRCAAFVSPSMVVAAGDRGWMHAVDPRAKSGAAGWVHQAHEKNIRSIQVHPHQEHMILSSTGGEAGEIAFHDTRMAGKKSWKPVVQLRGSHDGVINAVAISPDGQYFVSVGQDDAINTWDCDAFLNNSNTTPQHRDYFANNLEGRRFLCSIRPVFDFKHPHTFAVGSMESERCMNFFMMNDRSSATEGSSHIKSVIRYSDKNSWLKTLCPRVACHPSQFLAAAGNGSGKVYLLR